ncbi:hypothetical protein [Aeromicrobium sp. UC242_57]|uniref:hypothetical protein n=1 Tax=Aeromicrobium sp. UC242_57 TaxID=3374624 RepID=UPI00379AAD89
MNGALKTDESWAAAQAGAGIPLGIDHDDGVSARCRIEAPLEHRQGGVGQHPLSQRDDGVLTAAADLLHRVDQ